MPYSPYWVPECQSIIFIDFLTTNYSIGRLDYKTGKIWRARIIGEISPSFIIKVKNQPNVYIVGLAHQAKRIYWNGTSSEANVIDVLFSTETTSYYATNHFHFGKVDPKNRLYFGTIRKMVCNRNSSGPSGSFYYYTKASGVRKIVGHMDVAGGIGWNIQEKLFYGVDTCHNDIYQFNYTVDGQYCEYFWHNSSFSISSKSSRRRIS